MFQENKAPNSQVRWGGAYIELPLNLRLIMLLGFVMKRKVGGGGVISGSETKPIFNTCMFQENKAPNSQGGRGGCGLNHLLNYI